jgi:hypothetical protein
MQRKVTVFGTPRFRPRERVARLGLDVFAASRTVGLFAVIERGLQPEPHDLIRVVVELLDVLLAGLMLPAETSA